MTAFLLRRWRETDQRKRAGEKLTRARKKQRLDAVAAAAFLQIFWMGSWPGWNLERAARHDILCGGAGHLGLGTNMRRPFLLGFV